MSSAINSKVKPLGLKFLSIFFLVQGLFLFLVSLWAFVVLITKSPGYEFMILLFPIIFLLGYVYDLFQSLGDVFANLLLLIFGVFSFIVSRKIKNGNRNGKLWPLIYSVLIVLIHIFVIVLYSINGAFDFILLFYPSMIIYVWISLYLLLSKKAKEYFSSENKGTFIN